MIAKRITSKAATSRMARLVRYVVAAEGGIDPRSWARTADYILASKTNEYGEKVGGVRVTNCNTDDPAVATTLIEATQRANTRSKTDKTYHLVFGFPPGEQPDLKTLHKIEDELVAAIGYAEHQRISAVHIDTDHLHVHVAINKVHPTGYQNIEPFYDKLKLMEACERLELEYGLTRTNHGLTGEKTKKEKLAERQAQAEAHTGVETLTSYVAREVVGATHTAKDWNELHNIFAKHGLQIKKRGAGLVIGNGETWIKASAADRSLSMKALVDRMGEFQGSAKEPEKTYTPRPRQSHHSTSKLYEQYQRERQARSAARKQALDRLKHERAVSDAQINNWRIAQRLMVKATTKGFGRRALLKTIGLQTSLSRSNSKRSLNEKRQKIMTASASPSWLLWLSHQAQSGNAEALAVLRARGIVVDGDTLAPKNPVPGKNGILRDSRPRVDKSGNAIYNAEDGGIVIDRKNQVQSFRTTTGAALIAVELASKRFAGQALVVEGQDRFKSEVARLAGIHGLNVRFADKEMERTRQEAKPIKSRGKTNDREIEL